MGHQYGQRATLYTSIVSEVGGQSAQLKTTEAQRGYLDLVYDCVVECFQTVTGTYCFKMRKRES